MVPKRNPLDDIELACLVCHNMHISDPGLLRPEIGWPCNHIRDPNPSEEMIQSRTGKEPRVKSSPVYPLGNGYHQVRAVAAHMHLR